MKIGSLFSSNDEKEDEIVDENEPAASEAINPTEVELELKNAKRHGKEERKFCRLRRVFDRFFVQNSFHFQKVKKIATK